MKPKIENRYGKFSIDDDFLDSNTDLVIAIMSKCIIVRAEHRYDCKRFEYIAWSSEFDVVSDVCYCPEYQPVAITNDADGSVAINFKKL